PASWGGSDTGEMGAELWAPAVEVHQHDGEIVVRADLPGMKKEDVHVEITDQNLVIQGERQQSCEEKDEGHFRSECRYGSFYRSLPLPKGVQADDIKAEFADGVLEVRVPAPRQEENRKTIEVQSRKG